MLSYRRLRKNKIIAVSQKKTQPEKNPDYAYKNTVRRVMDAICNDCSGKGKSHFLSFS